MTRIGRNLDSQRKESQRKGGPRGDLISLINIISVGRGYIGLNDHSHSEDPWMAVTMRKMLAHHRECFVVI